jgi:DNA-binding MarR family transcriptional regulator
MATALSEEERLVEALNRCGHIVSRAIEASFAGESITATQYQALSALLEGPLAMSALAKTLGVSASNASGLVDRLEAMRLVSREPSSKDTRSLVAKLSPLGKRVQSNVKARYLRRVKAFAGLVSSPRALAKSLDEWAAKVESALDSGQINFRRK